ERHNPVSEGRAGLKFPEVFSFLSPELSPAPIYASQCRDKSGLHLGVEVMELVDRFSHEVFPLLPLIRERIAANQEEAILLRRLMKVAEDAAELRHRDKMLQPQPQTAGD